MKFLFGIIIIINAISICGVCQEKGSNVSKNKVVSQNIDSEKCSENPDALYNRQQILEQLAEILNVSVFADKKYNYEFSVEDEKPKRFFIYDLTETSNKGTSLDCVKLKNNHIYHFAPIKKRYSFSHIVVLENGNLKVFKSINCKGKGDILEDVINYASAKLKDDKNKDEILNRVRNYRKYGIYYSVDAPNLQCKSS
ncbi:MAG: hypothetical protein LUM44_22360 [Pyrinomonadaceae bacterium]|nr:hypothetical protein [Pyrinomonadaceae bacterium]